MPATGADTQAFLALFSADARIYRASVGDLVVSHDRVTLPDGRLVDQMKIYRVRNGLITHDWTAYEQAQ